jgi:hypothetical protein
LVIFLGHLLSHWNLFRLLLVLKSERELLTGRALARRLLELRQLQSSLQGYHLLRQLWNLTLKVSFQRKDRLVVFGLLGRSHRDFPHIIHLLRLSRRLHLLNRLVFYDHFP